MTTRPISFLWTLFTTLFYLQKAQSLEKDPTSHLKNLYESAHFDLEGEEPYTVEESENEITYTVPTETGKVEVVCSVENTDFASQCHAEWEKSQKKEPENKSKKKKKSHSPKAEVKISWSSK